MDEVTEVIRKESKINNGEEPTIQKQKSEIQIENLDVVETNGTSCSETASKNGETTNEEEITTVEPADPEFKTNGEQEFQMRNDSPVPENNANHDLLQVETEIAHNESFESSKVDVEMDSLIIDEASPELEFDEVSDKESGRSSPLLSRCKTRRSLVRNIPTPKTPKSIDDQESEKISLPPTPTDFLTKDDITESLKTEDTDNLSTTVEVGSDVTRLDFANDFEGESEFLNVLKSQSFNGFSPAISSRRSIHGDIRRKILMNNSQRGEFSRERYIDRAPSVKRKGRSETPEHIKRFKPESSGFLSIIKRPFSALRNKFSSEETLPSGDYQSWTNDENSNENVADFEESRGVGDRRWCSVM